MFWGQAGQGVYLNDQPVRVSAHERLGDCVIATDYGYIAERLELTAALSRSVRGKWEGSGLSGARP